MVSDSGGITIAAVGDIFPGDHYFSLGHGMLSRTESGMLGSLFADAQSALHEADLTLCNLEAPLSHSSAQTSPVEASAFRGIPQFADLLKDAGFTHVNIANNHIAQHGPAAFEETLQALTDRGMQVVGLSGAEKNQISLPVISRVRGRSVCVVGYSAVPERRSPPPLRYAHFTDHVPVAEEIASLSREYDHVVVSCHAGDEGMSLPSRQIICMYRKFIESGARCVLGHHPHVFQPVERHRDGLIAYSLGDFAFDLFWDRNAVQAAILKTRITSSGIDVSMIPTRFSRNYRTLRQPKRRASEFARTFDNGSAAASVDHEQYELMRKRYGRNQRYRKTAYFLRNLMRGDTHKKAEFLFSKLSSRFQWTTLKNP